VSSCRSCLQPLLGGSGVVELWRDSCWREEGVACVLHCRYCTALYSTVLQYDRSRNPADGLSPFNYYNTAWAPRQK
jgi:hypothetical protein